MKRHDRWHRTQVQAWDAHGIFLLPEVFLFPLMSPACDADTVGLSHVLQSGPLPPEQLTPHESQCNSCSCVGFKAELQAAQAHLTLRMELHLTLSSSPLALLGDRRVPTHLPGLRGDGD